MKLLLILLSLLFALNLYAINTPSWYHNGETSKPNTYIGYGSADTEINAKQQALSDIVSQISVKVSTSLKINKKFTNDQALSTQEYNSKQDSKATLGDYKLLHSEYQDAKYYVAISYENIPSLDKFIRKIKFYKIINNEQQNSYLKYTTMNYKLNKALDKNINFSLARKDEKWFIKYRDTLQVLDKKDFSYFFSTKLNGNISISTNIANNILHEDDMFYFKVKSKKKGYVSILTVYEDGTVSTLVKNIPISTNKLENIPDKEFETIPQAGLMQNGKETFDLYVVLYSPKKMHFDRFAYADDELIDEEKYKNFDELIEFLNNKEYATLRVVTKPK